MPLILSIESSTSRASLAVVRDTVLLYEGGFESDRNHNSMLFEPLQEAIDSLAGETLDLVVIGTGPGSYSGTRVGIAAGQGVAMIHGCPAVGLSSLLAVDLTQGVAIGDARRGRGWWARLDGGLPAPELVDAADLAEMISGVQRIFSFEDLSRLGLPNELKVDRKVPTARCLAEAWLRQDQGVRDSLCKLPPQPAYLSPPHITKAKPGHPLHRDRKR